MAVITDYTPFDSMRCPECKGVVNIFRFPALGSSRFKHLGYYFELPDRMTVDQDSIYDPVYAWLRMIH